MTTYTRFTVTRSSPSLWRVRFDNPPINLIDAVMIRELLHLLTEIERDKRLGVVLFDSADPDFFLAHYDIAGDPAELEGIETTAGRHPFTELHIRLSKSPAVAISPIRGRARGADVLGQFEIGVSTAPGWGLETGQDFNGEVAERYGYINCAIPDDQFVDFVDAFGSAGYAS